jgi:hypothetical protein
MNREELQRAVASAALEAGRAPSQRSAYAELIIETIQPNRLSLDVFNAFLPTRQLNVGDSLVKRTSTYGLPVRTFVPGVEHLADQLLPPREVLTYVLEEIITKVGYSLWEVQRGELYTLDQIRTELQNSLVDEIVRRLDAKIGEIWTESNTPDNYTSVSGALTETALEDMIETILLQAGRVRAIVGTRSALLPIYKFAGVYEQLKMNTSPATNSNPNAFPIPSIMEEWARTGRLTSFRGIPLIELPQVFKRTYDGYDTKLIRDDIVKVIGDNAGEVILYGGVDFWDYTDNRYDFAPNFVISAKRQFGCIVDAPERVGIIQIV